MRKWAKRIRSLGTLWVAEDDAVKFAKYIPVLFSAFQFISTFLF
jgi:hypothetical protein